MAISALSRDWTFDIRAHTAPFFKPARSNYFEDKTGQSIAAADIKPLNDSRQNAPTDAARRQDTGPVVGESSFDIALETPIF